MMMDRGAMDQSKKTMRHFYCRDVLWETFEQMANDFDCSIDYLINESMRFYARSKNYQAGSASSQNVPAVGPNGPAASVRRPIAPPPAPPPPAARAPAAAAQPGPPPRAVQRPTAPAPPVP